MADPVLVARGLGVRMAAARRRPGLGGALLDLVLPRSVAVEALEAVDLELFPGEIVAVVGGAGSGKSTLLRTLAGLQRLSTGEVRVHGVDPARDRTALSLQLPGFGALDGRLPVSVALERERAVRGLSSAVARDRVEALAALLGVNHLLGRLPRELSAGEQARCALLVALLSEPELLLIDAPELVQDPVDRARVAPVLAGVAERGGSVLLVAAGPAAVVDLADRMVVLSAGRVRFDDAPMALRARASALGVRSEGTRQLEEVVCRLVEAR